jgi:hypothetical protein
MNFVAYLKKIFEYRSRTAEQVLNQNQNLVLNRLLNRSSIQGLESDFEPVLEPIAKPVFDDFEPIPESKVEPNLD